jgi:uncharacterized protein (TIGR02147 family)
LSSELAEKVSRKLDLNAHQKTLFNESLKAKFARSEAQKAIARAKLATLAAEAPARNLEIDLFKAIANWHHFALIELIKLGKNRENRVAWFSEKLGISENETLATLNRLERLELISREASGGWTVNQDVVIADRGVPTESVRAYHRQLLEKATQALTLQTGTERYGSSSTIPFRVKNLARAKKLIQDFRLEFDRELSDDESGEEIYGLSIQFFRLTQTKTKEKTK